MQLRANADSYITRMAEVKSTKMARLVEEKERREAAEMAECTGVPQTINCPKYVERIAQSMRISKKYKEKVAGVEVVLPTWK